MPLCQENITLPLLMCLLLSRNIVWKSKWNIFTINSIFFRRNWALNVMICIQHHASCPFLTFTERFWKIKKKAAMIKKKSLFLVRWSGILITLETYSNRCQGMAACDHPDFKTVTIRQLPTSMYKLSHAHAHTAVIYSSCHNRPPWL